MDLSMGNYHGYAVYGSLGASAYAGAYSQEVVAGSYSSPWTGSEGSSSFNDNFLITSPDHASGEAATLSVLVGLTGTTSGDYSGAWISVNGHQQTASWTMKRFTIDFRYNEWTDLTVELGVWAKAGATDGATGSSYAGYFDTAKVGEFQVFDLNGEPVTNFVLATASGHAYDAVIPEPTSLALFGIGGAALALRRFRRGPPGAGVLPHVPSCPSAAGSATQA
ncbi:MAG: PEP-CTERM sorting domain-containing protein [Verrucomicrobia bacterium]|nr:PEP-CTERM sorting domain-containing protein [Verrucomicrobiota bacterium]